MNIQMTLAARYLFGRKLRTLLTTLAIVFGVLVIFSMNTILPTLLASFTANIMAASGQVDITITHQNNDAFSTTVIEKVKAVPGIRAITGSLNRTVNLPAGWFGRSTNISAVALVGVDPRSAGTVHNYALTSGRFIRADDDESAVITSSLAEQLAVLVDGKLTPLKVGDTLNLPTTQGTVALTIVGLRPARSVPGNEEIVVSLYEAQKLLDLPKRINTIEANFNTTDEVQRAVIQKTIETQLGKDYEFGALSSGAELLSSIQVAQSAFSAFGFLALFMGGFIIFNTFRTIVAERRHDIGMLRALGASRRTIIGIILAEGFLQGCLGTAIGMGAGYLLTLGLIKVMGPIMTQFIHLEMGSPIVSPATVIITVVLGVGVTLISGLLPAISASRLTPLDALRPASADVVQKAARWGSIIGLVLIALAVIALFSKNVGLVALGSLAFLIGLVFIAPLLVRPIAVAFGALLAIVFARQGTGTLAQGNLTRQPSRSAITASATMIGLAVIVAVGGLTSSLTGGLIDVIRKSLGSDYLFIPPAIAVWQSDVGANRDLADRLRQTQGVGLVSTMRYAGATVNGKPVSLLGIDPSVFPKVSALNFQNGDAASAYAALSSGRYMIANGVFASSAGVKVGDTISLSTTEGQRDYQVIAIAGDYLNLKVNTAYISQANLSADFHKNEDIFIQVNLAPGADPAVVEPKLRALNAKYPQFNLVSGQAYFQQNKDLLDAAFAGYYALFIVLALPSLISILNTLAIGVIERTREIGMLRAIGSTRGQVRQMVLAEAVLLAATGTAFGLLAGLYLGYVMVTGLASAGFPVEYSFPVSGLLVAVAVGLIFGVVAAIIPARQASQMEIVKALRYE